MPEPEMTDDQKRAKIQELYEKLSAKGYFQTAEGKQAAQTLADAGIITARRIDRTKPLSQYDTAVQRFPDMPEGLRGGGGDKVLKATPSPKQAVAEALAKRQAEARAAGVPIPNPTRRTVKQIAQGYDPNASMRMVPPEVSARRDEEGVSDRARAEAFKRIVPGATLGEAIMPATMGAVGGEGGAALGLLLTGGNPVGGIVGGALGGMGLGMGAAGFQNALKEQIIKSTYGPRAEKVSAQLAGAQQDYRRQNPTESTLLETAPQLLFMRPTNILSAIGSKIPKIGQEMFSNAPPLREALSQFGTGVGMGAAQDLAVQLAEGQGVDPKRLAQQALLGGALSGPPTGMAGESIRFQSNRNPALTRRVQQQRAFERTADAFAPKPANQVAPRPRSFEPPVIPGESRPVVDTRPVVGGEQQPTVESVVAPVAKRKGKTGTADQPVPEVSPVENASKTAPIIENVAETPISPTEKSSKPDFNAIVDEWSAHKQDVLDGKPGAEYIPLLRHLNDVIGEENANKFVDGVGNDLYKKIAKGEELTTPEKAKVEDTWDSIFEAPAPADSSTDATTAVETTAETPVVKPPVEQPVVPPADVTEPPTPTIVQAEAAKAEVDSSVADAPTTFAPPTRRKKPAPASAEPPAEPPTDKEPADRVTPGPEAWFMSHAYLERTAKDLGYEINSPYEQTKLANEMYKAVHASATDADGNSYNPHEWEVENLLQTGIDAKRTISEDERIVAAMMLEKARAEYNLLSLKENPTPQEIAEANGLFDRMRRLATIVHLGGSQAGRSLVVQKSLLGEADSLMSMIGQLDRVTEGGLRDEKGNLTTRGEEVVGELRQQYDALVKAKAESEAALMARAQEAEAQLARLQEIAKKNKATGKAQGGTGETAAATSGKSEGKVIAKSRDGKIEIYEHELVDRSELEGAMARIRKSKEEPEVQAKKKENGC